MGRFIEIWNNHLDSIKLKNPSTTQYKKANLKNIIAPYTINNKNILNILFILS